MNYDNILESLEKYYSEKLNAYGPTARGVDWNSHESQTLRFEQLLKVCDASRPFSINDYGCGYGALVDFMLDKRYEFRYRGFDLSEDMVNKARELHGGPWACGFFSDDSSLEVADYTIASGIFNVKLGVSNEKWQKYILHTVRKIAQLSRRGFAFNLLTIYSDKDRMRPDLFYGDPCFFFDHCKINFSKNVALLHDYGLYEFTIHVKF